MTIGGTTAGAGNVISANGNAGIWITGAGTAGVVVQHNFIGTDVTGTKALGNAYSGVAIDGGAANTTIGGTTADAGNVIRPTGRTASGSPALGPPGSSSSTISSAPTSPVRWPWETRTTASRSAEARRTIPSAGPTAGAGNVISANRGNGIWITGTGTTGVVVQHNFIGTDVTGTMALGKRVLRRQYRRRRGEQYHRRDHSRRWQRDLGQRERGDLDHRRRDHRGRRPAQFHRHRRHRTKALGNAYSGVAIDGGAANTTIGGTTADAGNVISANRANGIWISDAGTTGVVVQHNFIGTDLTGTKALGNAYQGVKIDGGVANNTIGGATAGAGNVISANQNCGILIAR